MSGEVNKPRTTVRCLDPEARECNFLEVSFGFNEEEAKTEAQRCLKCGLCSECYQCVDACLAEAIDHGQQRQEMTIDVGADTLHDPELMPDGPVTGKDVTVAVIDSGVFFDDYVKNTLGSAVITWKCFETGR